MHFSIYAVSKKLNKSYLSAIAEYEKRLHKYCKIKLILLKNTDDIAKYNFNKQYIISVNNTNPSTMLISSEELASKINHLAVHGKSDISLLINIDYKETHDFMCISFMDMDIALLLTILYEQIYRSYRILRNEPYHK